MRVELITPIARLHGKLSGRAPYYFKTVNGKTFVQRCPNRVTPPTRNQTLARSRFRQIAVTVAQMRRQGSHLTQKELWTLASTAYDAARH
ncbi:MAG: hypothetical protein IK073_05985 [Paludibacteraceae bacterium]|nr:hypothetical protein [Paludibacteraceae bacterium]